MEHKYRPRSPSSRLQSFSLLYNHSSYSGPASVYDDFKPDWNAFESDFKLALEEFNADPSLTKRLNTESSGNVAYGKAIYAAGAAAVSQVKSLKNWNKVLYNALFFSLCVFVVASAFI